MNSKLKMSSSSSKKLKNLQNRVKRTESRIAELENLIIKCSQDIKAEINTAKRSQLDEQINNYDAEIDKLYRKLGEIESEISNIKSSSNSELSLNNHLDNPTNHQELSIDQLLPYIDFKKALDRFNQIQVQFNQKGDVALFFIEKSAKKRGDLYLQRLSDNLIKSNPNPYRQDFRYCPVRYTSGNLKAVVQEIGRFFGIQSVEAIELVIHKIGNLLQNDSVLFIEINCDIYDESEIDPLIPWFIKNFWQPLKSKVDELTKYYEGIKVIAIFISKLEINQRLLTDELSYYKNNHDYFVRNKLIEIPLEDCWTEQDIFNWLRILNKSLTAERRKEIACQVYKETDGEPNTVCYILQKRQQELTC